MAVRSFTVCATKSLIVGNIIGGGIDVPLTKAISIRPVQVDYLLTRFGNGFTGGNNNQSNFRYQAGISFRF